MIEEIGIKTFSIIDRLGRFGRFTTTTFKAICKTFIYTKSYPLVLNQMNIIGVKSVPVVMATGAFVGMILAIQAFGQLASMGLEERLGVLINIAVVKELGPVLAAVMLAGRVGGALTAELGTMNVTEQIAAVESIGVSPVHYLVAPRVLACLLLTPLLIIYADLLGILGGFFVSVKQLGINAGAYWNYSAIGVELWDVGTGIIKGFSE